MEKYCHGWHCYLNPWHTSNISVILETLQALKRIPEYQYIVRTEKHRDLMYCIFRSAKKMEGESMFVLEMTKKLWNHSEFLMQLFLRLELELHATHEHSTVRKFLPACYRRTAVTNFQHPNPPDEDGSSCLALRSSLSIEHQFQYSGIRRTIIQFGRCFLTGSMSGFFACGNKYCICDGASKCYVSLE